MQNFLKDIASEDWNALKEIEDLNDCTREFENRLLKILNKHCPLKKIQVKKNYTPWLNEEIKSKQIQLENAKLKATRSETKENKRNVHKLSAELKQIYNNAEDSWKQNQAAKHENDPSMSWKQVNDWLHTKTDGAPKQLKDEDGTISNSPKKNAEIMNNFFMHKVKTIQEGINDVNQPRTKEKVTDCEFNLKEVSLETVLKAAAKMKNSTSLGPDGIQADLFKKTIPWKGSLLTDIINRRIRSSTFPEQWKTAKVIPNHKKGSVNEPKNFRPVSLFCPASCLLERIICDQVIHYLETNNLIHPQVHG